MNKTEQIEFLHKKLEIDKHKSKESNTWMFDTETFTKKSDYFKQNGHVTTAAIYGEHLFSDRKFEGITPDDFKNFIINETKKKSMVLYFHNVKYDMSYLIQALIKSCNVIYKDLKSKSLILKEGEFTNFVNEYGHVYYYKFRFKGCKYQVTFKDSFKKLPKSIAELAEYTPYEKFEDLDFDTIQEVKTFQEHTQEVKERVINDVKIGKYMLKQLLQTNLPKGLTAAGIAMSSLKHELFLKFNEWYGTIASHEEWLEYKDSYKGGAVLLNEKHRNKRIILHKSNYGRFWDIKSSYPNQAVNYSQPYGSPVPKSADTLQLLKVRVKNIKIKKNKMPCLLLDNQEVCKKKWLVVDSNETLNFTIWEKEFNFLKDNVYDMDSIEIIKEWSFKCDKTLAKWFAKMFEYKQYYSLIGNEAMTEIYKLMINSALGKFGQNPYTKTKRLKVEVKQDDKELDKTLYCDNVNHQKKKIRYETALGTVHECEYSEISSKFSYVPLVSHITSGARLQLFEMINYKNNAKYFVYSDTDSVLFTHGDKIEFPTHHIEGNELGNWALEMHSIHYINVIREKGYRVKGITTKTNTEKVKTRMSGLSQKIADNIPDDDFKVGYKTQILKSENTIYGTMLVETTFEIKPTYKKRGI